MPHNTFFVKGQPDQKEGIRLPRTSLAIVKQSLQKIQRPFQKGTKGPIVIPTRALPDKSGQMDNTNLATISETSKKIVTEPAMQFAKKALSSSRTTYKPPPKGQTLRHLK